jgi:hypothetical protein
LQWQLALFYFGFAIAKKATATKLPLPFVFSFVVAKKATTILLAMPSFLLFIATKKAMAMSHCLLLWFYCSEKDKDDSFRHLL